MKCPACEATLRALAFADKEIDLCDYCGGVWCDEGELVPVVHELIREGRIPENSKKPNDKHRQDEDPDAERKECPRCLAETESFNYAYDSNIFLNRCKACSGIWLDGGELREVALFIKKSS